MANQLIKEIGKQVEPTKPGLRLMPVVHTMSSMDNRYQLLIRVIEAPQNNKRPASGEEG